jgi:phage replication-related protein YjqB (UPF0714/DUF867 family)
MIKHLTRADFQAETSSVPGLRGVDPNNLCNRGHSGMGVQLELTRGLREKMFEGLDRYARCVPNGLFDRFIMAVRKALAEHN